MRIEHFALNVAKPAEMAQWYARNLGMRIVKSSDQPPFAQFLADDSGVMLELYCNTAAPVPDRSKDDPLVLHIAFTAKDVKGLRAKLIAAGAKAAGDVTTTPAGDVLAIVRDPWGLSVQLASRAKPLV